MKRQTTLVLLVVLVAYVVFGGVVFSYLESGNEQTNRDLFYTSLSTFQANYGCINNTDVEILNSLFETMAVGGLTLSNSNGIASVVNHTRWDYFTSIFVAVQLVATEGYRIAAPKSTGGRIFTVFFTILVIPLFVLSAIGFGQLLNFGGDMILRLFARCRYGPRNDNIDMSTWMNLVYGSRRRILYRSLLLLVVGTGLFVLIPGVIFSAIENWSYGDSLYYIFTTIVTIGFDGFVPGYAITPNWMYVGWYRLAVSVWLLIVIGWYLGTITVIQSFVLEVVKRVEDEIETVDIVGEQKTIAQYTVDQIGMTSVVNVTGRVPNKKFRPNFWQRPSKTGTPNMALRGNNVTTQSGAVTHTSVVKIGS